MTPINKSRLNMVVFTLRAGGKANTSLTYKGRMASPIFIGE